METNTTPTQTRALPVAAPLSCQLAGLSFDLSFVDPAELKPNTLATVEAMTDQAERMEASHAALVAALESLERKARELAEYPHTCDAKSQLAYRIKQLEAGANAARAALNLAKEATP